MRVTVGNAAHQMPLISPPSIRKEAPVIPHCGRKSQAQWSRSLAVLVELSGVPIHSSRELLVLAAPDS